jgi:predicted nucleotide-binding protein (sugar kinase/HSP70/actin superfamily)
MKIGIPRAFLYYKYRHLWENFLDGLEIETVISPETNREILLRGTNVAIDETCLSSKIYLGHVDWLKDRCDAILIPRISGMGSAGTVCTKFQAIYDIVINTYRNDEIRIVHYNIDDGFSENEMLAFLKLGKALHKKKSQCMWAYLVAKQAQNAATLMEEKELQQLLDGSKDKMKFLMVAHRYNLFDRYLGEPVLDILKGMGIVPLIADYANSREALRRSENISKSLPWAFNKELVGSIDMLRDRVDGIVLMSTFPCGPDSLVHDVLIRRIKDKPILSLVLDDQESKAGLETRLESFVDIVTMRKKMHHLDGGFIWNDTM